ncbi:MAG TPA: hypothetical protein VKB50_29270 [Vicinamibacterales bacterium]|nr:hypothetical protein [Vicinamibacterales bacterium]
MYVRRVFAVCALAAMVGAAWPVVAQRNNDNKQKQQQSARSPQEQQDVQALVQAVDGALMADTGIPVPNATTPSAPPASAPTPKPLTLGGPDKSQGEIPIKWEINHFVKGQTDTYIPFTLNLDRASVPGGAAVYIRIVNAEQANAFASMMAKMASGQGNNKNQQPSRPTFAWDSINFVDIPEDGRVSRAVQLKPGQYAMFVAVKEKTPASAASGGKNDNKKNDKNQPATAAPAGKVGVLRHDLTVPDFTANELSTSSVIIAKSVDQVAGPTGDQESNPYVFGPMKITPSIDGKFSKKDELSVIFWIYGAQAAAGGKPDVTIDFNFHQRLPEGEKYFNKTAPQQLNAQTLPQEFSVEKGHQLPGSLVVPLESFPAGEYRLEIKVTDKPSGKTVTQNVNFTVLPV